VNRVVWSLGSNLGDRLAHLQRAVDLLAAYDGTAVLGVSGVYLTPPWGPVAQPDYLNVVLVTGHGDPPEVLLGLAHVVEAAELRARAERWGPRTLDVDLVTVGELAVDTATLTLPHPRAHERAFVLVPWLELDPQAVLPGRGPVAGLLAALPAGDRAGVRRQPELRLQLP
jgi:2-amino-4-hydroxy-6-hydroxymethyldihydropteridine diphosphokinase